MMKTESGTTQPADLNKSFRDALAYKNGEGVERNPKKAVELLNFCAQQEHVDSQYLLGRIYHTGNSGIKKDLKKAFQYYEQAASRGMSDAMNSLGLMYLRGQSVERDFSMAYELFCEAALKGHPHAHNNVAIFYIGEQGVVERDLRMVVRHLLLAVDGGFQGAIKNIETVKCIAKNEGLAFESLLNS